VLYSDEFYWREPPPDIDRSGNPDKEKLELMKRRELIKHLTANGAFLLREGRRHSIYQRGKYRTEIPRHTEIADELARKICRDLDVAFL
jgi:predicted RNA binding protein YcfA (HicA-like mRNA interferase family)